MATKTNAEKLETLQAKLDGGGTLTEKQQATFDDLTEKETRREELQAKYDNSEELTAEELDDLVDLGGEVEEEEEEEEETDAETVSETLPTSNPASKGRKAKARTDGKSDKGAMEPTHLTNTDDSDRTPEARHSRDKVWTAESRDRWDTTNPADVLKEQQQIREANK